MFLGNSAAGVFVVAFIFVVIVRKLLLELTNDLNGRVPILSLQIFRDLRVRQHWGGGEHKNY
jgi:hypothetical protein